MPSTVSCSRRVDRVQVALADVLGGVDAEAGDAVPEQLVEVAGQLRADRAGVGAQVGQADQLAVEHLLLVVEVLDASAGRRTVTGVLVEVLVGVEPRVAVALVGDTAVGRVALAGHVVDDGVDVHLHAGLAAGPHHRLELLLAAHPAGEPVVDGLVDLPPRVQDRVRAVAEVLSLHRVLGRRDLDAAEAVRARAGCGTPWPPRASSTPTGWRSPGGRRAGSASRAGWRHRRCRPRRRPRRARRRPPRQPGRAGRAGVRAGADVS